MRKRICFFLLACILVLTAACGPAQPTEPSETTETPFGTTESQTPEESTSQEETTPSESETEETEPSESETPEETTPSETEPQPPEPPKTGILDKKLPLDDKGILWQIPSAEVAAGVQQQMIAFGENLLIYTPAYDPALGGSVLRIKCLSLETGEVTAVTNLQNIELPSLQVCGNKVAVCDGSDGEILVLGANLEIEKKYTVEASYEATYVDSGLSKAYVLKRDGIAVTELSNGASKRILSGVEQVLASALTGNQVTFTCLDSKTQLSVRGSLNVATGEVVIFPLEGGFSSLSRRDASWMAQFPDELDRYLIGDQGALQTFRVSGKTVECLSDGPAWLLLGEMIGYDSQNLTMYRLDGGYLTGFTITCYGGMFQSMTWSESCNGYFFLVTEESGQDRLLFCDLTKTQTGSNLEMTEYKEKEKVPSGTAVSQSLYERAAAISQKYGVTVRIADQCEEKLLNYEIERELNGDVLLSGLNDLEKVMSEFPEGFFVQLRHGDFWEIEINLVTNLRKISDETVTNGFSYFVGFVGEGSGKLIMAVDLTQFGGPVGTMYHEISHLIDRKLAFDAARREGALYSEEAWAALNPADFRYQMTTATLRPDVYTDGYDAWFIDIYSRTFPTEDRARIFEYAMETGSIFFKEMDGRMAKLEYYCRCIRDGFDTTNWPKVTKWEQVLADCGIQ